MHISYTPSPLLAPSLSGLGGSGELTADNPTLALNSTQLTQIVEGPVTFHGSDSPSKGPVEPMAAGW